MSPSTAKTSGHRTFSTTSHALKKVHWLGLKEDFDAFWGLRAAERYLDLILQAKPQLGPRIEKLDFGHVK